MHSDRTLGGLSSGAIRFRAPSALIALLAAAGAAAPTLAQQNIDLANTQIIATGLGRPVALAQPPGDDSRLFILEQTGRVRVIVNDVLQTTAVLDLSGIISGSGAPIDNPRVAGGIDLNDRNTFCPPLRGDEQGLLGIAFDPNFQSNGFFYLNYTVPRGATSASFSNATTTFCNGYTDSGRTLVVRYQLSPISSNIASPATATTIIQYDQDFTNHNGGNLVFGPDNLLYIGTGDGGSGNDPNNRALNPNSLLGKMLRINPAVDGFPGDATRFYSIPTGNPFNGTNGLREIWQVGLRNPWRYSFDSATGDLVIADVGQNAQEEIDWVTGAGAAGGNYGWRVREGTLSTGLSSGGFSTANLIDPIYVYTRGGGATQGFSVTGGFVYRGSDIPAWRGRYFFADYVNPRVWSFRRVNGQVFDFQNNYAMLNSTPAQGLGNIASFGQDNQNRLYILEFSGGGRVRRIIPQFALADYNLDGAVNSDDVSDFITDFFASNPNPGPGLYAVPCPDAPNAAAPLAADAYRVNGYAVDINGDCSVNTDDISDYITLYFNGN